jgi:hypothetical protein
MYRNDNSEELGSDTDTPNHQWTNPAPRHAGNKKLHVHHPLSASGPALFIKFPIEIKALRNFRTRRKEHQTSLLLRQTNFVNRILPTESHYKQLAQCPNSQSYFSSWLSSSQSHRQTGMESEVGKFTILFYHYIIHYCPTPFIPVNIHFMFHILWCRF